MLVKVKPPNFSSKKVILRIWYRCRVRYLISIFSFIRHKSYELLYFLNSFLGAFDPSQTVPAVNCGENAPRSQARQRAPSLLIGHTLTARHRGGVPHRNGENPSGDHHTGSRTL